MGTVLDAKKEKIEKEQAWEIIRSQKKVYVAKGKTVAGFEPSDSLKENILSACMGRSGTLRAPALISGDSIYVGFTDGIYDTLLSQ